MWRKNLRNNTATGGKCNGVDLNRNFDFYWMSVIILISIDIFKYLQHLYKVTTLYTVNKGWR